MTYSTINLAAIRENGLTISTQFSEYGSDLNSLIAKVYETLKEWAEDETLVVAYAVQVEDGYGYGDYCETFVKVRGGGLSSQGPQRRKS